MVTEPVAYLKDYGKYYKISVVEVPVEGEWQNWSDEDIEYFRSQWGACSKRFACRALTLLHDSIDKFKLYFTSDIPFPSNELLEKIGRYANNVVRARSVIEQLGNCNEWDYFVTFTIDPAKYDRYDFKDFYTPFSKFVNNYKRKTGVKFRYVFVPEQHKDGAWHLHGLIGGLPESHLRQFGLDERLPEYIRNKLMNGYKLYEWPDFAKRFGYTVVEPLRDADRAANYITKYIGKGFANDGRFKNARLFIPSLGLNRAEQLVKGCADMTGFSPVYECEFSKVYKFSKEEYSLEELEGLFVSVIDNKEDKHERDKSNI